MSTSAPPKLDQPLPTTPSAEWADKAHAALHEQQPALVPVTLAFSATAPSVASPILEVPGAFPPEDLSASTAEHGPSVGAKESLHNTAEAYIAPERLDQVEHLVEGVGSTAARYVPTSVSSAVSNYWYGTRRSPTPPTTAPVDDRKDLAAKEGGYSASKSAGAAASSSSSRSNTSASGPRSPARRGSVGHVGLGLAHNPSSCSTPSSPSPSPKRPSLSGARRRSSVSSMIVLSSLVLAPAAATAYSLSKAGGGAHSSSSSFFGFGFGGRVRTFGFGAALTLFYSAFALADSREPPIEGGEEVVSPVAATSAAAQEQKEEEEEDRGRQRQKEQAAVEETRGILPSTAEQPVQPYEVVAAAPAISEPAPAVIEAPPVEAEHPVVAPAGIIVEDAPVAVQVVEQLPVQ